MLPSVMGSLLEQGLGDYLKASFWSSTPGFEHLIGDLVAERGALFQGPYINVRLPFVQGASGSEFFPDVPLGFPPHRHQEIAFERLSCSPPQNTLVATGTGSGKTESFLVPILADCLRRSGPGVKAIIVYPMNALATDQARRIAQMIHNTPSLRGKVTAGLYVRSQDDSPPTTMGEDHVIADREALRRSPPDLLLTNYKMLDYLLMRPADRPLWRDNGPETLRFVVVDELHTFDGAQGTDLACLLRRLKARLSIDRGHLCCVGTSATLGGEDAREALVNYARQVFGEPFDDGAIVGESRKDASAFLFERNLRHTHIPECSPQTHAALDPRNNSSEEDWLEAQRALWFPDIVLDGAVSLRVALSGLVGDHLFFHLLLRALAGGTVGLDDLLAALARSVSEIRESDPAFGRMLAVSFLGMISAARRPPSTPKGRALPFLQVQMQLWQRELRRMVATVASRPSLRFFDDLQGDEVRRHLPIVHCRDCGLMGWATMLTRDKPADLRVELTSFYRAYFAGDPRVRFVFPEGTGLRGPRYAIYEGAMVLHALRPNDTLEDGTFGVRIPDNTYTARGEARSHHHCPQCRAHESLSLVGARAASLTSTHIGQLFSSPFNDDKRLLAFSDSVQDAAHRAGFFNARTWRIGLRIALQQVVQTADEPLRLSDLSERFAQHWRRALGDDRAFVGTFIPPNMVWLDDYEALMDGGAPTKKLLDWLQKRLDWEICAEYGLSATIGRTLPRMGCSVAYVDPERLDAATVALTPVLQNEVDELRSATPEAIRRFLLGMLERLRLRGGVMHEELPEDFLGSGGKAIYKLNIAPHMPEYSRFSRMPALLTGEPGAMRFDCPFVTRGRPWTTEWCERALGPFLGPLFRPDLCADVYARALDALVKASVLEEKVQKTKLWGLRPDALLVTSDVTQLRASASRAQLTVPSVDARHWHHAPTLDVLGGVYVPNDDPNDLRGGPQDYFGQLYRHGQVHRVVAQEHTGLLDPPVRKAVEESFKKDAHEVWDPNLLSCTPTLEMGIDIGALSTVVLCQVPPAQANYLQRIGRAGRRDGNALVLTIANGRPHDLYFFSEPEEMISGQVRTPGVFLGASAVLERQLTAYCLDQWARDEAVDAKAFPTLLQHVLAALDNPGDKGRFPYNLLAWIENRQKALLEGFSALFAQGELDDEGREHLESFMAGDGELGAGLAWRLLNGLEEQRQHRKALRKQRDRMTAWIRELRMHQEKRPLDEAERQEMRDLRQEKKALVALIRGLEQTHTMGFFTDEGLLPNYAFPEAGVRLRSVIWRKLSKGNEDATPSPSKSGKARYNTWTYEFERAASSAIVELAPNNTFYAGGRKVAIDQVDLSISERELWRFCPRCSYACRVDESEAAQASCPMCQEPGWRNREQKRSMLKLRQVFANTHDKRSRIADDSDVRRPRFYSRQRLVHFARGEGEQSWAIEDDDFSFGFDYVRRATLREINFGEQGDQGDTLSVAGTASVRKGFTLCTECGKVQQPNQDPIHAVSCPVRRRSAALEGPVEDCLYLYREFQSEAVRVLLPFVGEDSAERQRQSFVAALELGLGAHFRGQVDHLQVVRHSEPIEGEDDARKQYLVIIDKVPGGTGYLKHLSADRSEMESVLSKALDRLRGCPCGEDLDKDGCYRCLYAFGHSQAMDQISRRTAMEMLGTILGRWARLDGVASLGAVSVNALFDSELEARFIEALRRTSLPGLDVLVSSAIVRGRPGYRVTVGQRAWEVEPQVNLGPDQGVAVHSKPDFVFWPVRGGDEARPIAIFADGWGPHQDRIGKDMIQRMALARSGRFWSWSLTWHDLNAVFGQASEVLPDIALGNPRRAAAAKAFLGKFGQPFTPRWFEAGSLELLLRLLAETTEGAEQRWQLLAFLHTLPAIQLEKDKAGALSRWRTLLDAMGEEALFDALEEALEIGRAAITDTPSQTPRCRFLTGLDASSGLKPETVAAILWLDDASERREGLRPTWNAALRLWNILQRLPWALFLTRCGDPDRPASTVLGTPSPSGDLPPDQAGWEPILAELLDEYRALAQTLRDKNAPLPTCTGYELTEGPEAGAQAELVWDDLRIALIDGTYPEDRAAFEAQGWRVLDIGAAVQDPEPLLAMLRPRHME